MKQYVELLSNKKLLVGVTGSIAVAGLPQYLTMFGSYFDQLRVIITPSAQRMIPSFTVSLFTDEVYDSSEKSEQITHVELAKWPDLFILFPATANILGLVANGIATNFLTSTVLASPHPLIIYPNMNTLMWEKPAVQRNIKTLEDDGHTVIQPYRAQAYEVASRSIQTNLILPPAEQVLRHLVQTIQLRDDVSEVESVNPI